MNERTMRFRIGLFVLIALVLLGTMVLLFGSLPTFFKRTQTYTVRFTDAPGVSRGVPVRRSGVRIGEVSDVILDEDRGIVRVKLAIDSGYSIRRNEQPTLVTGILGGDVSIDLIPQQPDGGQPVDREPVEPGAEMIGIRQVTVNTLINRASEVVPTTQETLNDIRKSIQRLERMAPLIEDTLKEYRSVGRSANEMVPELRKTNDEYRKLAQEAREFLPDLKRTNQEVRELAKSAREALPDARNAIEDVAATARIYRRIGDRLNLLLETNQDKIVRAIENINEVLTRISNVLSEQNQRYVNSILKGTASLVSEENQRYVNSILKNTANLVSEENQRNVTAILQNTRKASESLESLLRNTDEFLKDMRATLVRVNETLKRLDDVLIDLQRTTKPLGERTPNILRNLDESLEKVNRSLGDLNQLMRVLDQSDGTLRRILTDPSLYQHLDEVLVMVGHLMPRLDRILKDFETFADKLARHPEAIGLGGVVHPGSGLKEPPTAPHPR
jgi:ABC-type transporter Mla subunit MlaD